MGQDLLFNYIPVPSIIINLKNNSLTANEKFAEWLSVDIKSLTDFEKILIEGGNFANYPKSTFETEGCIKLANGNKINVIINSNPINDDELLVVFHELNIRLLDVLKYNDFNNMIGETPIGIIIKNLDTNITLFVSSYLTSKLGYTDQEIASKLFEEITYSEDIPKENSLFSEMKKENITSIYFDKRLISKSGKIYWFSEFVRNFSYKTENLQLILLRDITNEKEIETELQRAKRNVEDAERLKSAFLDNMPHEIRTPLHAITGFTSLLSDSDLTHDERLEYVKFIQDSSNDILNLMDNIIEIAKLETNQVKPKKEKCYINSIFDKLQNDIEAKQNILEKDYLKIKVQKGIADPLFMIFSDPERLYQIFSHLLNNALKFTEQGEISFGYSAPKNGKIEFFVKDTGIGISENELDIIFKKFGKSGNINTNKNRGSGLGLTLSKKLVELLNGEIKVVSKQGIGSEFTFYIPIETEQKISITKPSVTGDINWSAKTILIAEDTESNYFFIEAFLERTKVNLLWAQDGNEAIKLFQENNVNLVLMDIMMPEKDGYDATREIKEIDSSVPVIAQTALALPDDEEKCYQAGCDYVLVKPINSEDLIATIKRFIL